jgi:acetyl-CoA carboxylase biotin carboxyl carrier protein
LAHEHLTYDDLLRIVELIKSSEQFSEFRLKVGEIEVELRRRSAAGTPTPVRQSPPTTPVAIGSTRVTSQAEPTSTVAALGVSATLPEGSLIIRSPMVGVFYRAPEPGAAPFVEVGQTVEPDTTLCIVEVMKLMNSISAGAHGTVAQILVDDAAPVKAEQPLIVLQRRPASQ